LGDSFHGCYFSSDFGAKRAGPRGAPAGEAYLFAQHEPLLDDDHLFDDRNHRDVAVGADGEGTVDHAIDGHTFDEHVLTYLLGIDEDGLGDDALVDAYAVLLDDRLADNRLFDDDGDRLLLWVFVPL
jgi:hypothetical protein